jgi:hypothetical protein
VFREVADDEREWLHATRPGLMDRISASMGRHVAACIAEDLAAIRANLRPLLALAEAVEGAPECRVLEAQCKGFDDPDRNRIERLIKCAVRVRLVAVPDGE